MNIRFNSMLAAVLVFGSIAGPLRAQEAVSSAVTTDAAPVKPKPSQGNDDFEYKIDRDNALQVDVCGPKGEKVSQTVRVTSEGTVTLPFVGEIALVGLTVSQAQKKIKDSLNKDDFSFSIVIVSIVEYSTVSIVGEVNKPGVFPFKGRLNILELLALAGGLTEVASPNEVKVNHTNPDGSKSEKVVQLYNTLSGAPTEQDNFFLRAGDEVIVPRSTVTIIGEVIKPGTYPTRGRMTIAELLAVAGGFTKYGSGNAVRVIHVKPDGTKENTIVRAQDLISKGTGNNEDLLLRSGDLVIVPSGMF